MSLKRFLRKLNRTKEFSITRSGRDEIEDLQSQHTPKEDVLTVLSEKGNLSIKEIADVLDRDPQKVEKVIYGLVKDGLITGS